MRAALNFAFWLALTLSAGACLATAAIWVLSSDRIYGNAEYFEEGESLSYRLAYVCCGRFGVFKLSDCSPLQKLTFYGPNGRAYERVDTPREEVPGNSAAYVGPMRVDVERYSLNGEWANIAEAPNRSGYPTLTAWHAPLWVPVAVFGTLPALVAARGLFRLSRRLTTAPA